MRRAGEGLVFICRALILSYLCFALWIDFKCNRIALESIRVCPGEELFPISRETSAPPKPRRNVGKGEKRTEEGEKAVTEGPGLSWD